MEKVDFSKNNYKVYTTDKEIIDMFCKLTGKGLDKNLYYNRRFLGIYSSCNSPCVCRGFYLGSIVSTDDLHYLTLTEEQVRSLHQDKFEKVDFSENSYKVYTTDEEIIDMFCKLAGKKFDKDNPCKVRRFIGVSSSHGVRDVCMGFLPNSGIAMKDCEYITLTEEQVHTLYKEKLLKENDMQQEVETVPPKEFFIGTKVYSLDPVVAKKYAELAEVSLNTRTPSFVKRGVAAGYSSLGDIVSQFSNTSPCATTDKYKEITAEQIDRWWNLKNETLKTEEEVSEEVNLGVQYVLRDTNFSSWLTACDALSDDEEFYFEDGTLIDKDKITIMDVKRLYKTFKIKIKYNTSIVVNDFVKEHQNSVLNLMNLQEGTSYISRETMKEFCEKYIEAYNNEIRED